MCNHILVDGFGGMGDALVCCRCGLDKYPEAIPIALRMAFVQRRVIRETHPRYRAYVRLANRARAKRHV